MRALYSDDLVARVKERSRSRIPASPGRWRFRRRVMFWLSTCRRWSLARGGKAKRDIDLALLADHIETWRDYWGVEHAFVEQVGAMPGQGVSSMFAFGKSFGAVLATLATLKIPTTLVTPQKWKKALGVPAAKDGARARASQLMPQHAHNWPLVKHDGRAESALLAYYGAQTLRKAAA
jgi:crossover junction endodeoxyribonuclease RuvC